MRSMGAAAVFETAAETPPTVWPNQQTMTLQPEPATGLGIYEHHRLELGDGSWGLRLSSRHTQEIRHEGLCQDMLAHARQS